MEKIIIAILFILPFLVIYYFWKLRFRKPLSKKEINHYLMNVEKKEERYVSDYKVYIKHDLRSEIIRDRGSKNFSTLIVIAFFMLIPLFYRPHLTESAPFISGLILFNVVILALSALIFFVCSEAKCKPFYFEKMD